MAGSSFDSRRRFLNDAGRIVSAAGLAAAWPGLARAQGKPITVGFLYTGVRQDYGWNQAHTVAARQLVRLECVNEVVQEHVPESAGAVDVKAGKSRLDGRRCSD